MKHAYLIMTHNEFDILKKSLLLLDDKNNDIYIHVDKKVKDFDFEYFKNLCKKSNVYFTSRIDVKWGSYKQIMCEYILLKEATKRKYDYYHIISGVDMPIASNDKIQKFFLKNKGVEFVAFDNHKDISEDALSRVKYYHFPVSWARSSNKILRKMFGKVHFYVLKIQKLFKVNRLKNCNWTFRKGANWVSITHEFANYVISKENEVKKIFKYSFCADELFIQTLLYNSDFYKNVCSLKNDDTASIKRYIDWQRGCPYSFKNEDFDEVINSKCFWARKFSTKENKIIDKIFEYLKEVNNE